MRVGRIVGDDVQEHRAVDRRDHARLSFSAVQVGLPAGPPRLLEIGVDIDSLADKADEPSERIHRRAASDDQCAFALFELELSSPRLSRSGLGIVT